LFHVKHETPPALAFLEQSLADAKEKDLYRPRAAPPETLGRTFCSNDYLGLADRPAPATASGAGASRLVAGDRGVHARLEAASAELVGHASALVFTTGYTANVGLLTALAQPGDVIVSDALNHASLIDGARLSRARIAVVPHLDIEAVEQALSAPRTGRAFIVTESYFSMDADTPDLAALRALADAHGAALIVDEAHALGVLGPGGAGVCAERGVRADAVVGTFGKAFGAGGAFVAGCPALVDWLWNRSRPFVFSTGLSPAVAQAALDGMRLAGAQPHRREAVARLAASLREGLGKGGRKLLGYGHIVPWVIGEARAAVQTAAALRERGIDIRAIRPPSVPPGTSRLRFTVTAAHDASDVDRVVRVVREVETIAGRVAG
jgi:8-amino-7-oxononanoate synthase